MRKAVLLAGGTGSRMGELCRVTNKHLLPVGDKPMLFWPLQFLVENQFRQILIVVGQKGCGEILRQVGNGSRWPGVDINYTFQEGEGGIAAALSLAEYWTGGDDFAVMLGDNVLTHPFNLVGAFLDFRSEVGEEAHIFCCTSERPELYGCALLDDRGKVLRVVEKPTSVSSFHRVVIGLYFYRSHVFDVIRELKPSTRGELEISDVNQFYARQGSLGVTEIEGFLDMGTPEFYVAANEWARNRRASLVGRSK